MDSASIIRFFNGTLTYGLNKPLETPYTTLYFVAFIVPLMLASLLLIPSPEAIPTFAVPVPDVHRRKNYKSLEILSNPDVKTKSSSAIQCYSPATGRLLGRVNPVTADGVDRAVIKAREAQAVWRRSTWSERKRVLRCLSQHILENSERIARVACVDSGKTMADAALGEVMVTVDKIRWVLREGEHALRPERRQVSGLLTLGKKAEVRYEPLGVLVAAVSWNYPFHNALNPVITAIATGNALLLKPSEQTTHSSLYYAEIVTACLKICGAPTNLIQFVPCWPSVADHLTSHPGVAHVTFIGSRPVAHLVAASAAKSLTPCVLELGGKDPAIVLDGTPHGDLERVASLIMRGCFQAAGQNCIGIERVIAQPGVCGKLLAILEKRIKGLRVGSALDDLEDAEEDEGANKQAEKFTPKTYNNTDIDIGALINSTRIPHLEYLISSAVSSGATLLTGGTRYTHPRFPSGSYFAPTLLAKVRSDMAIAQEELFAPVMLVFDPDVCASNVEKVLETANGTGYALGASVFGKPGGGDRDVESVVRGLRCGMVSVGDVAGFYLCGLPFGGGGGGAGGGSGGAANRYHGSGYGRFGGIEGLRGVCAMKSVCRDGWWGWFRTTVPGRMDYLSRENEKEKESPKAREAKRWGFVMGIILLGFGQTVAQKFRGMVAVLSNM